jgi:hypothetical protein
MGIRDRLRKLEAQAGAVVLELRDGSRKVFSDSDVWGEMFLAQMDLFKGDSRDSEVLQAVRQATPESRQRFEEQHGPINMTARIIAGGYEGAWVRVHTLHEDGTVTTAFHEGGSEEAERIRLEAQRQGPAF